MWSVLVSEVQEVLQPHPCVLGVSQQCLVPEQTLVVAVKGCEVRNNLCHHLGDVMHSLPTLSFCSGVGGAQETKKHVT